MHTPHVDELRSGTMPEGETVNGLKIEGKHLYKRICTEKIYLTKRGLENDRRPVDHERALFAYPLTHYNYWDENFTKRPIDIGALGENLVLSGANEYTTFIGDTYRFGEAVIQVSQPLFPRLNEHHPFSSEDFIRKMKKTGKTGWFYRVIEEGYVEGAVELELIDRPHPEWSIAAINEAMYVEKENLRLAYELSQCELLSPGWRRFFARRLQGLR